MPKIAAIDYPRSDELGSLTAGEAENIEDYTLGVVAWKPPDGVQIGTQITPTQPCCHVHESN